MIFKMADDFSEFFAEILAIDVHFNSLVKKDGKFQNLIFIYYAAQQNRLVQ